MSIQTPLEQIITVVSKINATHLKETLVRRNFVLKDKGVVVFPKQERIQKNFVFQKPCLERVKAGEEYRAKKSD